MKMSGLFSIILVFALFVFGFPNGSLASSTPYFVGEPIVIPSGVLGAGITEASLQIRAEDDSGISEVWMIIKSPTGEITEEMMTVTTAGSDDYVCTYSHFTETGDYTITFTAEDKNRMHVSTADEITITIVKEFGIGTSDINQDGMIDLKDAIIILKLLTGITVSEFPVDYANLGIDLNENDPKAGFEEAIYILQRVGGLRRN